MQKNGKNGTFFYKERKRTERTERSFEKNGCPTLISTQQCVRSRIFKKYRKLFICKKNTPCKLRIFKKYRLKIITNLQKKKKILFGSMIVENHVKKRLDICTFN